MTVYKRITLIVLIFIFALNSSGCSGPWRRKFVRKKKTEVKQEPVFHPEEYKKEFTNQQLYANHFAFWRAAESEFISCLEGRKSVNRVETYASYAVMELDKLNDLLTEDKQKELKPFMEELKEIVARIKQPDYVNSHRHFLVSISGKHYRTVSRRFSYFSIKNYIRPEEESEGLAESKKIEEPKTKLAEPTAETVTPEAEITKLEVEPAKTETETAEPAVEVAEPQLEIEKPQEFGEQNEPKSE